MNEWIVPVNKIKDEKYIYTHIFKYLWLQLREKNLHIKKGLPLKKKGHVYALKISPSILGWDLIFLMWLQLTSPMNKMFKDFIRQMQSGSAEPISNLSWK